MEDPVSFAVRLARQVNCSIPEDLYRDHENIVDCLRDVPLEDLLRADVSAPTYLSSFGPSVDGVVIKTDFQKEILTYFHPDLQGYTGSGGGVNSNMKRSGDATLAALANSAGGNRYDLLFGVVTSEALWRFSASDIQAGFEGERRDKIIRTYVRNAYTYHLSEIFFTVVNEYTDWERTVQHPINTRDATVAALSDAEFVAPLVQTGDLLSYKVLSNPGPDATRSYFYVFDYQTKDGDYPQVRDLMSCELLDRVLVPTRDVNFMSGRVLCVCVRVRACACARARACVRVCMYSYVCVRTCVCVCACTYLCVYVYIYIYIYIYMCVCVCVLKYI